MQEGLPSSAAGGGTSVLRSKTSAQGGIHFRRASLIKKGPRGEKPRGEKPGYEEKGAELRAKLGR